MNELYKTIEWFCKLEGKTVYGMCREIGISTGVLSNLKNADGKSLSSKTLQKISDYLDVSVDILLGVDEKQTPKPVDHISIVKNYLFHRTDIDDEMMKKICEYAEFLLWKSGEKK